MPDKVAIYIGASAYEGWERVSVTRSLMTLSGSFEVGLADRKEGRDWSFGALQNCAVMLGGDRVLTGFVDVVDLAVSESSHTVSLRGRDMTADLVDCAVVKDKTAAPFPGTLKKSDLMAIAKTLTGPFGITVVKGADLGATFKRFAVERGETVFEALDRACKLRGVIAITDPYGLLRLTVSGSARAEDTLKYGINVKGARCSYDFVNRFSHYRLETQASGEGDVADDLWKRTSNVTATFRDKDVEKVRFRPTVLTADADSTPAAAKARVAAEALHRAANSQTIEVDLAGWRQSNGKLWEVNQVVTVEIPPLYLKGDLLIVQAQYQQTSEEGTTTTLTLMRKDAFDASRALQAQQIKDPAGSRGIWGTGPSLPPSLPQAGTSPRFSPQPSELQQ